ncbi:hypothetical protein DM790_03720 [Flavobacterium collinsii]|nr:hypothetical protein [Flavobacterium collinsii]
MFIASILFKNDNTEYYSQRKFKYTKHQKMKKEIVDRIQQIGGNIDKVKGNSLQEDLQSIEFSHPLYTDYYEDELYGADEFYADNRELYQENRKEFYDQLLNHFFSDHELPYGQDFYRNFLFTPFKQGTKDFEEFDGLIDEAEVREVVEGGDLDFICICYSYGYPDQFFICLTDPNPENPTVYSTDHEVFFSEIENEGTLEEFLKRYLTKDEFLEIVKNYIENEKTDK